MWIVRGIFILLGGCGVWNLLIWDLGGNVEGIWVGEGEDQEPSLMEQGSFLKGSTLERFSAVSWKLPGESCEIIAKKIDENCVGYLETPDALNIWI